MTDKPSLLPHNATPLERSLEQATARIGNVALPILELWNPQTCPADLLPWLAWALSTDRWEVDWTEAQKRAAVAGAIEEQRTKGTPASIDAVLASYDELLKLTEWFEMSPPGDPHTFAIELPLIDANGDLGGERSSAAFAESIIRDVMRTKPARSHFQLLQTIGGESTIEVIGAGRGAFFRRGDFAADETAAANADSVWGGTVLTDDGEPIMDATGSFYLETI